MEIRFYQKNDGSKPAVDFLKSLDDKMRAKMSRAIDLLEIHGSQLRFPVSEEIDDGIMELRASFGGNIISPACSTFSLREIPPFLQMASSRKPKRCQQGNSRTPRNTEMIFGGGTKMTTWAEFKAEQMKNPHFKKEYDALDWEFALISARQSAGISQQELSAKSGITQADISKIENGKGNPSIRTLRRLAKAMNKTLRIEFA